MTTIRNKRQSFNLYRNEPIAAASGALQDNWVDTKKVVLVTVYDQSAQNQLTMGSTGTRIKQYDYLGLTVNKTLTAGKYRLKKDEQSYDIKGVNNEGRLAQLFLVVVTNGK